MADLFEGCSDGEVELKTENSYAKRYDEWRRKEELMKAKARFGDDLEDSSSSDEEEEDDEASQWTSEHEKNFLTTLSAIKARDPKIYNKDEVIFPEVSAFPQEKPCEKSSGNKKMTLKDYERKIMTTEGGIYAEEDEEQQKKNIFDETNQDRLAYDDEQRELRESLKKAAWSTSEQDDDEDEDQILFTNKKISQEEKMRDDEEYIKWLKGETKKLSNKKDAKDLATLKKLWSEGEENLDQAEKFLRDYVLNKKYLTTNEDDYRFDVDFSEDEKDVAAMTEFEHKYNFRFEDPDPEFIRRYPRTIEDSMRRKDSRRADKKAEKKMRREQFKIQMKEEVNRLKSFKKKEILEKIEKLKAITGSKDIDFDENDIEGEFDSDEHDKRMAAVFASYDNEPGEDVYPEIDENEHEDLRWENWDEYEVQQDPTSERTEIEPSTSGMNDSEENAEDECYTAEHMHASEADSGSDDNSHSQEAGNAERLVKTAWKVSKQKREGEHSNKKEVDAGIERNEAGKLLVRAKKSSKLTLSDVLPQQIERKRKKSKFAEMISKKKPVFDPETDKSFEKYFEDYYKLDFEDMVAGVPTRFKYRQVVPNDFGLSAREVLQSQDKELNKWCSLKKMVQYRSQEEENNDLKLFSKRRDHFHLKKKILTSIYATGEEQADEEIAEAAGRSRGEPAKKSTSRKNKKKKNTATPDQDAVKAGSESFNEIKEEDEEMTVEETAMSPTTSRKQKSTFTSSIPQKKKTKKESNITSKFGKKASAQKFKTQIQTHEVHKKFKCTEEHCEVSQEGPTAEGKANQIAEGNAASIPWDQLTPKQKKNRRNAMIKKRKKLEQKQMRTEKIKIKAQKFKPLEDLQISEARMKAYGLNPNRVKGSLVYGASKSKK